MSSIPWNTFPYRSIMRTESYETDRGAVRFEFLKCGHISRKRDSDRATERRRCGLCAENIDAAELYQEWIDELAQYRLKDWNTD